MSKPLPQQYSHLFGLQPDEGIFHTFLAKQPGPDICLSPVTMNFRYDLTFGIDTPPSAYEWLLHDAMHGDQTLFPRSDWIYRALGHCRSAARTVGIASCRISPTMLPAHGGLPPPTTYWRGVGREWLGL